jgi:phosphonatase-like hydrolase
MHVDLVVFDIAGTTLRDDDAVHRCLADALSAAAVKTTRDAINAVMGMPKPLAIRELAAADRGTTPDAGEVADIHADFERRMLQHYGTSDIRETAGASALFRGLRANGAKVALDTGFNRTITDAIVDRLGWRDLLDATVSSDEVPRGRPHPDLVHRAMELTGCGDPRRVAKVGDTPADLGEGTAAGCRFVVGVTSGSHTHGELLAHPHTHLVKTLDELWPILGLRTLLRPSR